jgi:phage shock protein PspC (stress-responsive transcriptional regulator)
MNIADEIQKLDGLRASGALTDEEYAKAKGLVLGGGMPAPATNGPPVVKVNVLKRFTRSRSDAWLGGVCGGLGAITPCPSWIWRIVFCVSAIGYGFGLMLYILLWIFAPLENSA